MDRKQEQFSVSCVRQYQCVSTSVHQYQFVMTCVMYVSSVSAISLRSPSRNLILDRATFV